MSEESGAKDEADRTVTAVADSSDAPASPVITSPPAGQSDRDVAGEIEDIPAADGADVLEHLSSGKAADVAEYLDPDTAAAAIAEMDPTLAASVIADMEPVEAA